MADNHSTAPTSPGISPLAATQASVESAPPKGARLLPGEMAGDYKIVRRIGGGAMGDVYEGVHDVIGKRVAIKVIKMVLADSDEAAERFIREARAVNRIDHPNVLDVFAFGKLSDGRLYLAMDLLEGESLGDRIRSGGAMGRDEFADVITPICRALSAAHKKGVVHRDLKPDNVFIAERDGERLVYVLDFGIAKLLSDAAAEQGARTLTGQGVWVGTPAYMAPEQWSAEGITSRCDLYALGIMAYEMLAGTVPFKAESVPGMMEKHFHSEVPSVSKAATAALPGRVDEVLNRALSKKPESRFDSAEEFLDAMLGALGGHSGARSAVAVGEDGGGPKRTWLYGALGVGVAGFAAATFALMSGDKDGTSAADTAESSAETADGTDEGNTPTPGKVTFEITSDPPNAELWISGTRMGRTPQKVRDVEVGEKLKVVAKAPGFLPYEDMVEVTRHKKTIDLQPVRGFDGVWKLDNGELRVFERQGEKVAVFRLATEEADPQFIRHFWFTPAPADDYVQFEAKVRYVDERSPRSKSCQFELRSRYRYHSVQRSLELSRERIMIRLVGRECRQVDSGWTQFAAATRVGQTADFSGKWAVSRAGGGSPLRGFETDRPLPLMLPGDFRVPSDVKNTLGNEFGKPITKGDEKPIKKRPPSKNRPTKRPPVKKKLPPAKQKKQAPAPQQAPPPPQQQRKKSPDNPKKGARNGRSGADQATVAGQLKGQDQSQNANPAPGAFEPAQGAPPVQAQQQTRKPRKKK